MEQNYLARAAKYLADLRRRKLWKKIVSGMGTVVVFCTVYALILPAITLTIPTTCGLEEHTHDESCYAPAEPVALAAQVPAVRQMCSVESVYADVPAGGSAPYVLHVHNEFCYRDGVLVCTLPEMAEHIHDDSCYTEVRRLICGLEETAPGGDPTQPVIPGGDPTQPTVPGVDPIQPAPGGDAQQPGPSAPAHHHGESCYEDRLICGLAETAGHTHTDECYRLISGLLTCTSTEEGHVHDEGCYAPPERQLVCGQEEAPAHTHTPACYQRQLVCTLPEGQPETTGYQNLYGSVDLGGADSVSLEDGQVPLSEMLPRTMPVAHVHTDACYETVRELTCTNPAVPHEHIDTCYNELGELTCGRLVVRGHVHSEGCFTQVELPGLPDAGGQPDAGLPGAPERTPICGKEEHAHTDVCYEPKTPEPSQEQKNWDAIFWSNTVMDASDAVLESSVQGVWKDSDTMDQEQLAALHNAASADLTRFLDQATIQVDGNAYSVDSHGPMDAESPFAVALSWTLDEARLASAGTMTYHYQFPAQIQVENIERRALSDGAVEGAVAYSVENNQLNVTYRVPAESVSVRLVLRASWAPELGESAHIQWSNGAFTDVTFAKPELTVTKTMGENGLRVEESGEVWADYTVTVANTGAVAAKEIALTDTMESTYFHFARGSFEGGADYSAAVQTGAAVPGGDAAAAVQSAIANTGAEEFLSFENYDGGNTLTFPAFDLAAGESRVFRYRARMSAEDRAAVDEAVQDGGAGETVRNTARATCPGCGEGAALTASSQGTYNGLESKHIEDFTQTYSGETFDVTFTVNGDARLPAGMTAEKLETAGGEGLALEVKELDESSEEYQTFAKAVEPEAEGETEDTEDGSQLIDLSVLGLELQYNGVKLDLDDCEVEATVTPNEALKNYREPLSVTYDQEKAEKEKENNFGLVLKAFTLEEETTTDVFVGEITDVKPVEKGSIHLYADTENDSASFEPDTNTSITFRLRNNSAAIAVDKETYPEYKVQYYAKLERLAWADPPKDPSTSSEGKIPIIDTSGKDMPKNSTPSGNIKTTKPTKNPLKYLSLTTTDEGKTSKFVTKEELTQIFTERTRQYNPKISLDLTRLDSIKYDTDGVTENDDQHYKLSELWVLNEGKTPAEKPEDDTYRDYRAEVTDQNKDAIWTKYDQAVFAKPLGEGGVKFTNSPSKKESNPTQYILVTDGMTFRMVYSPDTGDHSNDVNFYDYDISTGGSPFNAAGGVGINLGTNYKNPGSKLGFGNNNVGAPYGDEEWNSNFLNRFNRTKRWDNQSSKWVYEECGTFHGNTFGLVTGLDKDGNIQYASNVSAPHLFNEGPAEGKTAYSKGEYQLKFGRKGDTYTLTDVIRGAGNVVPQRYNKDGTLRDMTKLDELVIIAQQQWSLKVPVPTNSFWPMDNAPSAGKKDILFGQIGNTGKKIIDGKESDLDKSDDDAKHNSYFGMQFEFEFTLPEGYVGPLDYVFFGDDDLWMFLDGELVCDLGGVKSSTCGEYVNLADYIELETDPKSEYFGAYKAGTHKLQLFYLERGATGSTCWMQFTIPNIRSVPLNPTPDGERGSLRIYKEVSGAVDKNQSYVFNLTVHDTTDNFSVKKYDKDLNPISLDRTSVGVYDFALKDGESLAVFDLPKGKHFTITEIGDSANEYETTITSTDRETVTTGKVIEGTTKVDTLITVTYTNTFHYALPETGGPGTAGQLWYTYAALPVMAAAVVVYKRSRKKGGSRF